MSLLALDLNSGKTWGIGELIFVMVAVSVLIFVAVGIYESTGYAKNRSAMKFKENAKKSAEKARKHANVTGMSVHEAGIDLKLGNKCAKCKKHDFYLQPITISTRVGLGTVHNTYNIRFCTSCNVEFVPRILL
jgi:hypothetical protein